MIRSHGVSFALLLLGSVGCSEADPLTPQDVRVDFEVLSTTTNIPPTFVGEIRELEGAVLIHDTIGILSARYSPQARIEAIGPTEVVVAIIAEQTSDGGIPAEIFHTYKLTLTGLPAGEWRLVLWERHPHEDIPDHLQVDSTIVIGR